MKLLESENKRLCSKLLEAETARSQDFNLSLTKFLPIMMNSISTALEQQCDQTVHAVFDLLRHDIKECRDVLVKIVSKCFKISSLI